MASRPTSCRQTGGSELLSEDSVLEAGFTLMPVLLDEGLKLSKRQAFMATVLPVASCTQVPCSAEACRCTPLTMAVLGGLTLRHTDSSPAPASRPPSMLNDAPCALVTQTPSACAHDGNH